MTIPQSWRHERHLLSPDQESPQRRPLGRRLGLGLFIAGFALAGFAQVQAATLSIDSASWQSSERRLRANGSAPAKVRVKLVNAYKPDQVLGTDEAESDGDWSIRKDRPSPVPCSVRAITPEGNSVDRVVSNAPSTCSPKAPTSINQAPKANANGPYTGVTGTVINFSSNGSSDPDGNIASYAWNFGDGTNIATTANPSHAYATTGPFTVSLTVKDNLGKESTPSTTTATITAGVACNSPIQAHCDIIAYTGPEVCVACHKDVARDMHGSVHYQQGGAFPNVTNIPSNFTAAGERPPKAAGDLVATGINTYCGTHENSPRFTCAGCHVGNGRFPMAQSDFEKLDLDSTAEKTQLANIDCLMCHQEVYKRFPDWTSPPGGLGFSDFSLLNLTTDDATGKLVRSDGGKVTRTGFQGIPNVSAAGDFLFKPAGSETEPNLLPMTLMPITTLAAAQTVHATTRQSCLNCHAGAAGADGAKRGDLSKENINPSLKLDMHMSPAGENLTCSDCHNADGAGGESHRVRGRGLDLRANDVPERFTCDSGGCHSSTPHGDFSNTTGSSKDKHAMKVACQTCHIPSYAKAAVGTEVARDWQDPHPSDSACNGRGGWLPREDKGGLGSTSLIPSYTWFDGTSEVMYLGESLDYVPTVPLDPAIAGKFVGDYVGGEPAYPLGMPNGDVTSSTAKLYPMKQHWGKLARNKVTNTLVGHSTFEFFRTGSFCRAVAVGLELDEPNAATSTVCKGTPGDLEMPLDTETVPVFTYQTINHGVEPKDNALGGDVAGCGSCHQGLAPTGTTARLDTDSLGYGPRTQPSAVVGTNKTVLDGNLDNICSQCHSNERDAQDRAFAEVHKRHVSDKKRDCAACHNFSRPERSLSLSKG